jgi:hypothetical protein
VRRAHLADPYDQRIGRALVHSRGGSLLAIAQPEYDLQLEGRTALTRARLRCRGAAGHAE